MNTPFWALLTFVTLYSASTRAEEAVDESVRMVWEEIASGPVAAKLRTSPETQEALYILWRLEGGPRDSLVLPDPTVLQATPLPLSLPTVPAQSAIPLPEEVKARSTATSEGLKEKIERLVSKAKPGYEAAKAAYAGYQSMEALAEAHRDLNVQRTRLLQGLSGATDLPTDGAAPVLKAQEKLAALAKGQGIIVETSPDWIENDYAVDQAARGATAVAALNTFANMAAPLIGEKNPKAAKAITTLASLATIGIGFYTGQPQIGIAGIQSLLGGMGSKGAPVGPDPQIMEALKEIKQGIAQLRQTTIFYGEYQAIISARRHEELRWFLQYISHTLASVLELGTQDIFNRTFSNCQSNNLDYRKCSTQLDELLTGISFLDEANAPSATSLLMFYEAIEEPGPELTPQNCNACWLDIEWTATANMWNQEDLGKVLRTAATLDSSSNETSTPWHRVGKSVGRRLSPNRMAFLLERTALIAKSASQVKDGDGGKDTLKALDKNILPSLDSLISIGLATERVTAGLDIEPFLAAKLEAANKHVPIGRNPRHKTECASSDWNEIRKDKSTEANNAGQTVDTEQAFTQYLRSLRQSCNFPDEQDRAICAFNLNPTLARNAVRSALLQRMSRTDLPPGGSAGVPRTKIATIIDYAVAYEWPSPDRMRTVLGGDLLIDPSESQQFGAGMLPSPWALWLPALPPAPNQAALGPVCARIYGLPSPAELRSPSLEIRVETFEMLLLEVRFLRVWVSEVLRTI